MRLIQFLAQDEHQDEIFDILDEIGVDFVALSVNRRNASLVSFPVPPGAVEEILDQLRDRGFATEEYTIISDLDSAITPNFDTLEKQYTEGPNAESRISTRNYGRLPENSNRIGRLLLHRLCSVRP